MTKHNDQPGDRWQAPDYSKPEAPTTAPMPAESGRAALVERLRVKMLSAIPAPSLTVAQVVALDNAITEELFCSPAPRSAPADSNSPTTDAWMKRIQSAPAQGETPRTDKMTVSVLVDCGHTVTVNPTRTGTGRYVEADFARTLERELAELRKDAERYRALRGRLAHTLDDVTDLAGYFHSNEGVDEAVDRQLIPKYRAALHQQREGKP